MANNDYTQDIRDLKNSLSYLAVPEDKLSTGSIKILNKAYSLYEGYWTKLFPDERTDPRIIDVYSFQKYIAGSGEIEKLIIKLNELNEEKEEKEEKKEIKPKEQEASIPPELESLVAEYQQNQALLENEEIKSNSQRSVAEQVKIAIAHSKIKNLALANKQRRLEKGEKFQEVDKAFVSLGSPKSESTNQALSTSYKAVQEVAFTYTGFTKLSKHLQNEIITNAVELHTIGLSDLDTAIQSSTLQIDSTSLSESDKSNLATIPGGFVSTIYQEIKTQDQKTSEYQVNLNKNEQKIIQLEDRLLTKSEAEKAAISVEIKSLIAENEKISSALTEQEKIFLDSVSKQTEAFKSFSTDREKRLSQDPDLKDRIEVANKNLASIHNTFELNGVKPNLFDPLSDAYLLEQAIRQDMPGVLAAHAGYEAEYAAALINNPKTKDPNLSPEAILLSGKNLDPKLLAKARLFAKDNPDSALGKLFKSREDIFNSASSQIRKIASSPLGKEITKASTGLGKIFKPVSGFIGKISDKIPGGFGNLFRIAQDPIGAFRSWAGKKIGSYVVKKFLASSAGKAAVAAGKKLAGELLKKGIGKAVASIAVKLGVKLGIAATGVGAPVALILLAIDIVIAILKAVKNAIQKTAKAIFGEEIKSKDILGVLAVGAVSRTSTFIATLGSTVASAASSAGMIIGFGAIIVFIFYVTSFAVAPLLSTLVQLDSTTPTEGKSEYYGNLNFDCGPEAGAEITVDAGGFPVTQRLLVGPGRTGMCITPTKITIHWSGGSSNDSTYETLIARGLSCQIGTAPDGSVEQWQQMWEKKAELAYCTGGNENNYCLNNEMVGAWFIPPGSTPLNSSQNVPSEEEIQSSVNTTCFMMRQYNIPSSQIFGHYQLMPGKPDPGEEFLAYFINRVNETCP